MKDANVQWHPGFIGAMNLELKKNRDGLFFEKEYNLNTKPLEIDLLVIKKNTDVQIDNETGRIFRGHNILEYKSPRDELDIDTFYKAAAYASLYKSYGKTLDAVKADDVTVWLVPGSWQVEREIRAEGIDKVLAEAGFVLRQPGCSACLAMNEDKVPAGKYAVSTSNRNFEGRQGPGARTILAGPLVAAAAAVTGKITDPRELM